MKLAEYLPEVPAIAQQMTDLNSQINMLQLMKGAGETGEAPTIGLDHIVNTWVRHQMAYRQQLVMDLQTIAMSVEEIRSPLGHITGEVFRRGLVWVPLKANPNQEQRELFEPFLRDCNVFDQSLEEVLRQFHFDVNCVDDGFLYLAKEYRSMEDGTLRSQVKEIRRLNPALVEFDLDVAGLPKNAHFICPIHREKVDEIPGPCTAEDCDRQKQPCMYKYYHRNQHLYLFDSEVIHLSKFSPSETYGWSPILTVFEKALSLIGMDKNIYRYFFERKMPASMMMVFTDDPESLRRERSHIAAQTRIDPNYVPMVAVSAKNNRGRVDMVRLFHTLQEMDYLPVRNDVRERIAAMWGVTPAWQGAPEAFGGLSTQTQQLVVMSRVVEGDQRLFHSKVIPQLLDAFGITDWTLELPQPEEKAEATRISFAQQRVQIANQLAQLGFDVALKDQKVSLGEVEFEISGQMIPTAKMAGEQQAMALEQAQQQQEMMAQQMQQQQQAMQQGGGEQQGGEQQGGGEEQGATPVQAMMSKDISEWTGGKEERPKTAGEAKFGGKGGEGKFGGRTGWKTPDWHDKTPEEERDIDEYADARAKKNVLTLSKTWMDSLMDRGFTSPLIKEVTNDGSQMWFLQSGVDYVATLGPQGVLDVQKATFKSHINGYEKSNRDTPPIPDVITIDEGDI